MHVVARLCHRCGKAYWHDHRGGTEEYCRDCHLRRKRTKLADQRNHEYGPLWATRRLEAKRRDDFQCQECEILEKECRQAYGVGLHVHHIVPYSEFDDDSEAHDLDNLETLCPSCHARRE